MSTEHHGSHTHGEPPEEALALLKYMAHHNAHHTEELLQLAPTLPEAAAADVQEAARFLQQATEKLEQAIKKAEG